MARTTIPIRTCRGKGNVILKCIGTVKETEFYNTWGIFDDGKTCYCKKCCDKIFEYYIKQDCSETTALYYTLQKIDIPFIQAVYKKLVDSKKNVTVGNYIALLQENEARKNMYNDFTLSDADDSNVNQEVKAKFVQEAKEKYDELEEIWGVQDSDKDYKFLEKTFKTYTEGVEFTNPQQKDLYRDLCRDRLLLRKINDGRYNGEETLDKVQSRIAKTMSTLKVDQFESNKPKTLSEQLIFDKIAQIEMTKPADLYKEPTKYKDFNKVRKYYQDICLRALKNTLAGTKNFDIDVDNLDKYELEEVYDDD